MIRILDEFGYMSRYGTLMTQIRQISMDLICGNLKNQRYPCSIFYVQV